MPRATRRVANRDAVRRPSRSFPLTPPRHLFTAESLRRLERRMAAVDEAQLRTNARLDQTNLRLDQAIDVLTRLVDVVAAQNDRMNRNFAQLNDRIDRLARAIMTGRTADLRRLGTLERRMSALERRLE